MLLYHTNSWHYLLVLYVFTKEFFMETDGLDFKAMDSQYNPQTKTEDFKLIYKKKSRTVNFCPYCRAVLAASLMLPLVYLWRLYPHKPKPKKTHAQIMKGIRLKGWIARIAGSGINFALGIKNIIFIENDFTIIAGLIQIGLGVALLTGDRWAPQIIRWIIEHSPKRKHKVKAKKVSKENKPSEFAKKLHKKHEIICPPIFFIEENKPESYR